MTTPTDPQAALTSALVPSQRAREAALGYYLFTRSINFPDYRAIRAAEAIRTGGWDEKESVQAFARFEQEAAALATPPQEAREGFVSVPEGWVLVPREPTEAMCLAWGDAGPLTMGEWEGMSDDEVNAACARLDWSAMIAAAPSPPPNAGDGDDLTIEQCVARYREDSGDEDGFWRTCSGCYECEDGYPNGHYPHSKALGCTLGGGCSDCGGVGATWDTIDYEAMARDMLAEDATPDPSKAAGEGKVERVDDEALLAEAEEWYSDAQLEEIAAREQAQKDIRRYVQHSHDCLSRKGAHYGPESCDCGLKELEQALALASPAALAPRTERAAIIEECAKVADERAAGFESAARRSEVSYGRRIEAEVIATKLRALAPAAPDHAAEGEAK